MQRKMSKSQKFEKMKISIYKKETHNVESHRDFNHMFLLF